MKSKHLTAAILCLLALTVAGCKEQVGQEKSPVKVRVMSVERVLTEDGLGRFSGTVEESSATTLSFPVSGTVQRICVEAGQRVSKGELVAVLDEEVLRNDYDSAAAMLEQAEDAYSRMKQLYDAGSLPEMQWVEVQSRLKQAQSAERISKKNLVDGKLYAPFSGVVSEKNVEVGHNVMPGVPVVRLVAVNDVKVNISVPENEISHIVIGQSVCVIVPALDEKTFYGKIVEKGIVADPISRSYDVKALIDNPSGELMPGMICTLKVLSEEYEAIVLPINVIQTDEANRCFVWMNDGGRAMKRVVGIGRLERGGVQITSGLAIGDEVIVEGQQKVSEGMDVVLCDKE